jgi:hypothetical protein
LPDGRLATYVSSNFVLMSCLYRPEQLREDLTDHVQAFMNMALRGIEPEKSDGRKFLIIEEEAERAGARYADPELQQLLLEYSAAAYEMFTQMIAVRMHQLPDLLVEQILYKILTWMEEERLLQFPVKSGPRKMWDDLVKEYGNVLKEEWQVAKPGPREVTPQSERAEMLAFYNSQLTLCQKAKLIYKQNKKGHWRRLVKEEHPDFDDEFIASLTDHKPSEIATLITGRYFKKLVGNDYRGADEVRRQLGLARREAARDGSG